MKLYLSILIIGFSLIAVFFLRSDIDSFSYSIDERLYKVYKNRVSLDKEPIQKESIKTNFEKDGWLFDVKYDYAVQAKVLGKERYFLDSSAPLSRYDLALGWKDMAKEKNLKNIEISQGSRWYRWYTESFSLPRKAIEDNSANTHIIHGNEEVLSVIKSVNEGDVVELYGYLVDVENEEGTWSWSTSTTRNDTGEGSCEIFYVEAAKIISQF